MTTTTKETQAYISKMQLIGSVIAKEFVSADLKADETKRELILTSAKHHASDVESVKYILEGFALRLEKEGYSANIVKVRKSEANQVFKAVAITSITNDNLTALQNFKGSYHAFIDEARKLVKSNDLANKPAREITAIKVKAVRPLTPIQLQTVTDSLKKANASELSTIAGDVVSELNRISQSSELAAIGQLNLIANIANSMLDNAKFDKATKEVANQVFKIVNVHINKLESANRTPYEPKATPIAVNQ